MARYVDGFLAGTKEKPAGLSPHGSESGTIWRDVALSTTKECAGNDLSVKFEVPFPRRM